MKNIVVTGANGFIGKKLIKRLKQLGFTVFSIDRSTTEEIFERSLRSCDFCFHLAGEVRPNASKEDFYNSNVYYTQKIIDTLKRNKKNIPILYTSTIHAAEPRNDYSVTKFEAEKLISKYSNDEGYIFRLPHLFGPGCKPNYNSALATWVYNACNNINIDVFNDDIEMNYIHVNELIDVFIAQLSSSTILELPDSYKITLGELKKRILYLNDANIIHEKLCKFDVYLLEIFNEIKSQ